MTNILKICWNHLASVRLALFVLITLAIVSIAGTVIPQGETNQVYVERFGVGGSQIITMLRLDNMFNAGWFLAMLGALGVSLIACSCDRLPAVFRILRQDNLAHDPEWIMKRPFRRTWSSTLAPAVAQERLMGVLQGVGWKPECAGQEEGFLLFAQKYRWARLSAYAVHVGILVVLAGAIIGKVYGFKTSVLVPEGPLVSGQREGAPVPLPFDIRCDGFAIEYYQNGQPRQYRSGITLFQEGKEVHRAMLTVNDPVDYAGITLYQDRYKAMDNQYTVQVRSLANGAERTFQVMPHKQYAWPEQKLVFGIAMVEDPDVFKRDADGHEHGPRNGVRHELVIADGDSPLAHLWVNENTPTPFEGGSGRYVFSVKQRYYTGLQIVKDPGVWCVYAGFAFILAGLFAVFHISHRRIWVVVSAGGAGETSITLCGATSRNRTSFSQFFHKVADAVQHEAAALSATAGKHSFT